MGLWWETSEAPPVHLDPRIRDWVLMPIFLVMFMQGVLRHYATMCLKDEVKVLMGPLEENQLVRRSQRLRMNNQFIPPAAVRMRKAFFMQKAFKEKPKDAVVEAPPPQDPMAMMGMMKTNMFTMMLPNMVMMGWVSFFFSVLVRMPVTKPFWDIRVIQSVRNISLIQSVKKIPLVQSVRNIPSTDGQIDLSTGRWRNRPINNKKN
jgi:hypothetical protein